MIGTEGLAHALHQAEAGEVPKSAKARQELREKAGVSLGQLAEAIRQATGRPCKSSHVAFYEKAGTCPNQSPDSHDRTYWSAYQRAMTVFRNV